KWELDYWTGVDDEEDRYNQTITVTLDNDKSVCPVFREKKTLTVNHVTGENHFGTVHVNSEEYTEPMLFSDGRIVDVTLQPDSPYVFSYWHDEYIYVYSDGAQFTSHDMETWLIENSPMVRYPATLLESFVNRQPTI